MSGPQGAPRDHHPSWWYGDTPVPLHARLLAWLYGAAGALRRRLYRIGLLRRHHPGVPVVVVGNITAGGAGKTPFTIALVERLRAAGWNPGVASRGYGRDDTKRALWVDQATSPLQGGDEPVLIARRTGVRIERTSMSSLMLAPTLAVEPTPWPGRRAPGTTEQCRGHCSPCQAPP